MVQAYASSVINAPVDTVWAHIRDFNGLPTWHPAIADSVIEDGRAADAVGCVRSFHLADGGHLRERLLSLSDLDRHCTYSILVSPMPVSSYIATLSARPVTDGSRTFVEWTATFDTPPGLEAEWAHIAQGVFQAGFDALKERFGG
jgi:hypothetical protein